MTSTPYLTQPGGLSAISEAIRGVLHAPGRDPLGSSQVHAMESTPCEGADDLCGAPAGQLCEPWCPSWAADPE
ncbi:hypothetical protein SAMN05216207_104713 [Pseudonocardia ammonioxydans]|uniref:Uncharacterized protein n=1 Tax=Pseudonocardia ammonioxydans TaxID=260086 RepID=A0A1I5GIZ7_PSUAM|nr:hypothetical protein [Pseudonocardia ammonioxydans]SFO35856.1 hypothetical protein SAMN05216207_104713 [Pseudonocardia ammonioxydans]